MSKKVHLEGLGVIGSFLAWHLHALNIPFTWHDIETPVNAWNACTGAIYPSGDDFDTENYNHWLLWSMANSPFPKELQYCIEQTDYWFLSKTPPHKSKARIIATHGELKLSSQPSFHFNAQQFVPKTRAAFAACRVSTPPSAHSCHYIVSHGFSPERLRKYLWGWTAIAEIKDTAYAPYSQRSDTWLRRCYYLRQGRFMLAYLYPIAGTKYHYVGSNLISQNQPKSLDIQPKYIRVKRHIESITDNQIQILPPVEFIEGWRPAAAENDLALIRPIGNKWFVQPVWHSGVRHSPMIIRETLRAVLGVKI